MCENIYIRLASDRVSNVGTVNQRAPEIFTPGQTITKQDEFMRLVFILKFQYINLINRYLFI